MIRVVIIEDDTSIAGDLLQKLHALPFNVRVEKVLFSVSDCLEYLPGKEDVDLIFSDIQLSDGLSFTVFEKTNRSTPVVFITEFDNLIVNAFEHNGIDYLLKPVDQNDIRRVLSKYQQLEKHFNQHADVGRFFDRTRERLVVRKGLMSVLLKINDIVLFYTENKVVYVIDKNGMKYICEETLSDLQRLLDKQNFYRVNRQYIININFIKSYRPYDKVKLSIDLLYSEFDSLIVVSQETAPGFRKWLQEN